MDFDEFLKRVDNACYVAYQKVDKRLGMRAAFNLSGGAATVIIGPEGDFTEDEYSALTARGAIPFSMGNLTLRSETAAIVSTALIICLSAG